MTVALLTAAGSGTRMGQDIPKQFIHIDNKPVIIYTMEKFQNNPQTDAIVLVTLPHWVDFVWAYAKQFNITKLKWVVAGGETGQESIYNGLKKIEEEYDKDTVVMIHDGNRPMVDNDIIADSLAVFRKHGSAITAIPCVEAVFKSEDKISSTQSIPREVLLRTQTPHTYVLEKLLWAHEQAKLKGITNTAATCSLMCELGEEIYFSKGAETNLKLTTLEDLEIFGALLLTQKSDWLKKG